jgi:serine/threonine protein kinase
LIGGFENLKKLDKTVIKNELLKPLFVNDIIFNINYFNRRYISPEEITEGTYEINLLIYFFLLRLLLKSNIWSVGICMYELITHKYPFNKESYVGLVKDISHLEIKTFDGNYSDKLKEVICKMLIKVCKLIIIK